MARRLFSHANGRIRRGLREGSRLVTARRLDGSGLARPEISQCHRDGDVGDVLPGPEQHVTPPDLARFEGASEETPVGGIQRLEQEAALENGWRTFDGLHKALSTGDGDVG